MLGNILSHLMCIAVGVPRNISAPEFIGPIYTDMSYVFICRVVYDESLLVNFDVALTFDGELLPGVAVKKVLSTSSLNVTFKPEDFRGQIGKMV